MEFLGSLKESSHKRCQSAAQTYATSFLLFARGEHVRGEKWHTLDEDLGEYKHIGSKTRILHVRDGQRHILLFGFEGKKENKIDPRHIARAKAMRDEYFARKREIERHHE